MSVINEKVVAVSEALGTKLPKEVAFDPSVLLVLVEVVMKIIQAIAACQKPPVEIPSLAKSPGILGRFHVRRAVRQAIADDEFHTFVGPAIVAAVLKVGSETTEAEAEALFAEVAEAA